jgi:hypothetical protein
MRQTPFIALLLAMAVAGTAACAADAASAAANASSAAGNAAADAAPQVSAADRQSLEQLACQGPHQLPLDSIEMHTLHVHNSHGVPNKPTRLIEEADVRCRSHGDVAGLPLRYLQQCDATRQHWTCSPAYEEFSLTLNGREVRMSSAELPPAEVLAMAKAVARAAVVAPTADAPPSPEHCRVIRRAGADPDLYKLSCDVWELLVVRRCADNVCSYRAIDRGAPLFQ